MRKPTPGPDWPPSWTSSYAFDQLEVFGDRSKPGHTYAYQTRFAHTIDLVRRAAPPGARVLDLAAAQGNFTLRLAELGYRVTWNDLRSELADYVRAKHERGSVEYLSGNVFELELERPFDVVLLTEVIEHVAHPDDLLARAAKLVRPGGHLVVTTPNGEYVRNRLPKFSEYADPSEFEAVQFKPDGDGHIFLLHPDELVDLATHAGLEVQELRLFTNPLTAGVLRTAPLLRAVPRRVVRGIERVTQRLPRAIQRRVSLCLAALLQRPG